MKRVVLGGAQTHTSCSPGKCPKHLDHHHYMLFTVFNSQLRAHCSGPRDLDLECTAICSDTLNASAHLVHASVQRHLPICSTHLLDVWYHQLNVSQLLICIGINECSFVNNPKQTHEKSIPVIAVSWKSINMESRYLAKHAVLKLT